MYAETIYYKYQVHKYYWGYRIQQGVLHLGWLHEALYHNGIYISKRFSSLSFQKQISLHWHPSVQFSSVAQSCPTLCDPMNRSTPGLPVHHQLPEFTQIDVHRVSDAIQPPHPLSSPSPPAPNPSQHQSLFQWVNSSHRHCLYHYSD